MATMPSDLLVTKKAFAFFQNACLQHRFIRSKDTSNIVERPERLRAVSIGLAAAIARLEEVVSSGAPNQTTSSSTAKQPDPNDLAEVMGRMKLEHDSPLFVRSPVSVVQSQATVDILNNPAVKFVHGDIEGDVYLENLKAWVKGSSDKVLNNECEIPEHLSQGDLYLCPESIDAIQGAVGTVCQAVDMVVASSRGASGASGASSTSRRAFVAIRPPGHHCGEDTPSGFCFINNVAVGAAHAHLQHGINRIVIVDIDLHHGNGTQSIVWQINEETYRKVLEQKGGGPPSSPGPQIYYGSTHDILSYPCEDGKLNLIQAASVSIHKSHGQYIENVHLQEYTSEEHFWDALYKHEYSKVLRRAEEFLDGTGGPGDDVMVFISCGMDACEHEYESMSRHNRKVPSSFYYRFAQDACALSEKYARGRVVSVLEGGYSDRALISGAMAHMCGLVDLPSSLKIEEDWWSVENLIKLEKLTKRRRGGRPSLGASGSAEPWLERTIAILEPLETLSVSSSRRPIASTPPTSMTLRDRTKVKTTSAAGSPSRPSTTPAKSTVPASASAPNASGTSGFESGSTEGDATRTNKLPRVILRLGPKPPDTT